MGARIFDLLPSPDRVSNDCAGRRSLVDVAANHRRVAMILSFEDVRFLSSLETGGAVRFRRSWRTVVHDTENGMVDGPSLRAPSYRQLEWVGVIDIDGRITEHGRQLVVAWRAWDVAERAAGDLLRATRNMPARELAQALMRDIHALRHSILTVVG